MFLPFLIALNLISFLQFCPRARH